MLMGKVIFVVALIVAALLWWSLHEAPEATAFKLFYDELAHEKYLEAKKMIKPGSPAEETLDDIARASAAGMMPATTRTISYQSVECAEKGDGVVEVTASLTRNVDPPGVTSSFGTTAVKHRAVVTMEGGGDTWQVTAIQDQVAQ
jgi:hypothetical protein